MPFNRKVHLVSFAVPFPPNYGGVIDVYYKIAQLKSLGVSVILHAFTYGSRQMEDTSSLCEKVYYYERKRSFFDQFSSLPFIVKSRDHKDLLVNLSKDNHPILFEGLHTTYFINHPALRERRKFLRMHNIESDYYFHLYMAEKRWLNKIFFLLESKKLKRYEDRVLAQQGISILAISEKDQNYLKGKFGNSHFIGAFHSFTEVVSQIGRGNFAFYHGKLDVAENNEAAIFLVNEVFSKVGYPLIIAGANPSAELVKVVSQLKHVQIKSDLNTAEIHTLLKDAQINVLPTFQSTGVKLKLLSALFSGRFCLVNDMMVAGTSLQGFCRIANSTEEWIAAIDELREKEFSVQHIAERKQIEGSSFSNEANAKNLYALLFPSS